MPGLEPDIYQEDYVEVAFHAGYMALWHALEEEGVTPEQMISCWTKRKRSTVYAWRQLGQMPSSKDLWRLIHCSTSAGYLHLIREMIAPSVRLSLFAGEVLINNTYLDEIAELAEYSGMLARVERQGGSQAVIDAVPAGLRSVADRVEAQARKDAGHSLRKAIPYK